jgi:four helix bundle protein
MIETTNKIKSFTDLNAWKESHKLVLMVYEVTKKFPKEEMFSLVNQLRRAIVSVTSNIAEGFSRSTDKDKVHFYIMSLGSLTEVQNQIIISKDLKYITQDEFSKLEQQITISSKILNGLIKSTKLRSQNS